MLHPLAASFRSTWIQGSLRLTLPGISSLVDPAGGERVCQTVIPRRSDLLASEASYVGCGRTWRDLDLLSDRLGTIDLGLASLRLGVVLDQLGGGELAVSLATAELPLLGLGLGCDHLTDGIADGVGRDLEDRGELPVLDGHVESVVEDGEERRDLEADQVVVCGPGVFGNVAAGGVAGQRCAPRP